MYRVGWLPTSLAAKAITLKGCSSQSPPAGSAIAEGTMLCYPPLKMGRPVKRFMFRAAGTPAGLIAVDAEFYDPFLTIVNALASSRATSSTSKNLLRAALAAGFPAFEIFVTWLRASINSATLGAALVMSSWLST